MRREIFKKKEKPVEQTDSQKDEDLEYKLGSMGRPEIEQEQTEVGKLIDKAREKIKKVHKKQG